ncbi:hypothetical protein QYE76_062627 [Lolium multiflorum]|uniref:Uncharacterized protein n=1 Tax=Lolium multiflorum TaxID=4521 RepID=A0AAD8W8K5_LOLMU|nr:hypothetical protein QYE76_062627 [Lolium multiflorum]
MGITMGMLEETDTCFHGILPTEPGYSLGRIYLNVVFGKSDNFRKEKIEFERIAAKFGSKQEIIKPPPKLLLREIKEEKDDRGSKKKPADLVLKASTAEASAAGALAAKASAAKASAAKGSAVDDAEGIENSKAQSQLKPL